LISRCSTSELEPPPKKTQIIPILRYSTRELQLARYWCTKQWKMSLTKTPLYHQDNPCIIHISTITILTHTYMYSYYHPFVTNTSFQHNFFKIASWISCHFRLRENFFFSSKSYLAFHVILTLYISTDHSNHPKEASWWK
jgi:hypothetical protein